jgi:predicted ArsR family transcriptional regulator
MPRKQDAQSGKFSQVYTDEDFLKTVSTLGEPGTGDIATELGCSRDHARRRLRALENEGTVESRSVGTVMLWRCVNERASAGGSA